MIKIIAKIIIALAIFGAGFYIGSQNLLIPPPIEIQDALTRSSANVMLDFGNGEIKTYNDVTFAEGDTVFGLLQKVTSQNNLALEYKDYGGELGVLVESIGEVKNNLEQNGFWQYWVNNNYAQVGPSSYQLAAGDIVMWKYVKGQF